MRLKYSESLLNILDRRWTIRRPLLWDLLLMLHPRHWIREECHFPGEWMKCLYGGKHLLPQLSDPGQLLYRQITHLNLCPGGKKLVQVDGSGERDGDVFLECW